LGQELGAPRAPHPGARQRARQGGQVEGGRDGRELRAREGAAVEYVLLERRVGEGADGLHGRGDGVTVGPDLVLRVPVEAQAQEVEEVVEVDLPVHLGVERERQVDAGQERAYDEYESLLEDDVARELARINLPLSLYTL